MNTRGYVCGAGECIYVVPPASCPSGREPEPPAASDYINIQLHAIIFLYGFVVLCLPGGRCVSGRV